jgi:hypothetical protein
MYQYYAATGDAGTKATIEEQWAFIKSKFPLRRLTVYGLFREGSRFGP